MAFPFPSKHNFSQFKLDSLIYLSAEKTLTLTLTLSRRERGNVGEMPEGEGKCRGNAGGRGEM